MQPSKKQKAFFLRHAGSGGLIKFSINKREITREPTPKQSNQAVSYRQKTEEKVIGQYMAVNRTNVL